MDTAARPPGNVYVIDNGSSKFRVGAAGSFHPDKEVVNCLARTKKDKSKLYFGSSIFDMESYLLSRPTSMGYLVYPDIQGRVWEAGFPAMFSTAERSKATIVLTTPYLTPEAIVKNTLSLLLDDCKFAQAVIVNSTFVAQCSPGLVEIKDGDGDNTMDDSDSTLTPSLRASIDPRMNPACLIIDAGFSSITVMPVFNFAPYPAATRRCMVGGQILNSVLKERLAYTQVDLDDNPLLVERIRELSCRVSQDTEAELQRIRNNFHAEAIRVRLPSYTGANDSTRSARVLTLEEIQLARSQQTKANTSSAAAPVSGYQPGQDVANIDSVVVSYEQVTVPETVFHPGVHGLGSTPGLVSCIRSSIARLHPDVAQACLQKVILVGGLCHTPGFIQRVRDTLQELVDRSYADSVRIFADKDGRYDLSVFRGASSIAGNYANLLTYGLMDRKTWIA